MARRVPRSFRIGSTNSILLVHEPNAKDLEKGTEENGSSGVIIARPRIEGLSDLIFGLALSIGAIQLLGTSSQSTSQLLTVISSFGFSFLILIGLWNRYTTITSVMPIETTIMVRLNMLLLFLVVIEPYLFNILIVQNGASQISLAEEASVLYGIDLACMNLVLAFFSHSLTREGGRRKITSEQAERFRMSRDMLFLVGSIFALSALPVFWTLDLFGFRLRYLLWLMTLPMVSLFRLFSEVL